MTHERTTVDLKQLIVAVPVELHRQVKSLAANDGKSIRQIVLDLLQRWVTDRKAA